MVLKRLLQWHGFSAVAPTWPSGERATRFRVAGGRTMGSFEAILLVASSSAALFWLAVRMVDGEAEEEAEAVTRKEAADAED